MRHAFEGNPVAGGPRRFAGNAGDIDADDDTVELELSPQQMATLARAADEARTAANEVVAPPLSVSEPAPSSTPAAAPIAMSESPPLSTSGPLHLSTSSKPQVTPKRNVILAARSRAGTWPLARVASALGMAAAVIGIGSAAHRLPERASSALTIAVDGGAAPTTAGARVAAGAKTGSGARIAAGVGIEAGAGTQEAPSAGAGLAASEGSPDLVVRFKNPFDAAEVFEFPPGTSVAEARESVAEVLLQRARDRRSLTREELRRLNENLITR